MDTKHVEPMEATRVEKTKRPAEEEITVKSFMAEGKSWVGMQFVNPIDFVVFTPELARRLAIALRKHADKADRLFPQGKTRRKRRT